MTIIYGMRNRLNLIVALLCFLPLQVESAEPIPLPKDYCHWEVKDFAIEKPLCGLQGDAGRGRKIAADNHNGNCLACHMMPIPEEPLHGTVGPPLFGVGARLTVIHVWPIGLQMNTGERPSSPRSRLKIWSPICGQLNDYRLHKVGGSTGGNDRSQRDIGSCH